MASWGPLLWFILHTAAEHLGKQRPPINQVDEVQRWILLLKAVEGTMPCEKCRKHYAAWLKKRPVAAFLPLRGQVLRVEARKWLYDLHEEVNNENGIVSGITLESIPELYGRLEKYQETVNSFIEIIKEHVQFGRVKAEGTFVFRNHLHYLRKLTDAM
jgi:Erv1 / Alr family